MSCYVHHTPGRLRVKIPLVKGNQEKAWEVREVLNELNGVDFISINTVTGSVTVKYNRSSVGAEDILNVYKENYLFDASRAEQTEKSIEQSVANASQAVGRVLFGWAMGKMLEGSSLSILTALI